jgi:hypothetical protein
MSSERRSWWHVAARCGKASMTADQARKTATTEARRLRAQIGWQDRSTATIVWIELILKGFAGARSRQYRPRSTWWLHERPRPRGLRSRPRSDSANASPVSTNDTSCPSPKPSRVAADASRADAVTNAILREATWKPTHGLPRRHVAGIHNRAVRRCPSRCTSFVAMM